MKPTPTQCDWNSAEITSCLIFKSEQKGLTWLITHTQSKNAFLLWSVAVCEETFYRCMGMDCIPRYCVLGGRNMWRKQIRGTKPWYPSSVSNSSEKNFCVLASTLWGRGDLTVDYQGHWIPSCHHSCNSFHFLKVGERHPFMLYCLSDIAHANETAIHFELGYGQ